ncbi:MULTISPECIES: J domain-containing protein [unclassified Crossiella]|uniref:J domain-containing protein n=1 Tax=unclassified Crossiella TaxID=2620835 RepID=UPI0020001BDD|nr:MULTISPECIES: J domain-containing protein [unclassified Crossiella]MCK2245452.1 J domain-containing protein [Crossiella sp. S99.2]MCK2259104.1 J domain-containing protein [Crossiella sp. S99.1]
MDRFHQQYQEMGPRHRLTVDDAEHLMWELAGEDNTIWTNRKKGYRLAARRWHPDVKGGDETVFKLLQRVYGVLVQYNPEWR